MLYITPPSINPDAFHSFTNFHPLRQNWYMTSLKAGAISIQLINETVTSAGLSMKKEVPGLGLGISMQPITTDFVQAARTLGGDPIDLDPADGSFICKPSVIPYTVGLN